MELLRRHPMVALSGLAVIAAAVALAVAAGRSAGSPCALAPPRPQVVPQLLALGDFDQPYDASQPRTLEDAAQRVAAALAPDLVGTAAADPVAVAALSSRNHDAIVVPLTEGRPSRVAALVSFLRDCSGHAYYSQLDDLLHDPATASAVPVSFPSLSAADAAQSLGSASPQLAYASSPFRPVWRAPGGGRTIPAFPPS
ncbi:MAG: hypothetical protein E6J14_08325 [Chloroflexi bacterium]|nr:MAG: hypothetical protein E6J14_08325 [Chloroflexota bacterium]